MMTQSVVVVVAVGVVVVILGPICSREAGRCEVSSGKRGNEGRRHSRREKKQTRNRERE